MNGAPLDVVLAVDALSPRPSGIGRYVRELWDRLPAQPGVDRVRGFRNGYLTADPLQYTRGVRSRWRQSIANRPRFLRRWLTRRSCESALFHGPNFFLPPWVERGVVTVHDLSVFRYPQTHPAERLRQFERDFTRSLSGAMRVITDSATVRQELVTDFGVAPDRVDAVHLGVSDQYRPRAADELPALLAPFGIAAGSYTLCVSTLEPRKNIDRLIHAYALLPPLLRSQYPLVLAGGDGWLNDGLRDQVERHAAEGWLRPLGYVPEVQLPALYAGARLFVYPSAYEGFGLPPIEAMACGVPTLVANRSCLPEVTDGAARLVDPDDEVGFAESIKSALLDETWRTGTIQLGLAVSGRYTWSRCVDQTVGVYRRANDATRAEPSS